MIVVISTPITEVWRGEMKDEAETNNFKRLRAVSRKRRSQPSISVSHRLALIYSILAIFGLVGGISSLFLGIVSVILHGLVASDKIFDRLGTGLLIAAIPMILVGAIFLDKVGDSQN